MPRTVFISYRNLHGEWVLDRLVPVLKAAGVPVRVDRERFVAGEEVYGQMDAAGVGVPRRRSEVA